MHGKGKYTVTNDQGFLYEYEGDLKQNKWHGNGVMKYYDNQGFLYEYKGEFKQSKRHGNGVMKYYDDGVTQAGMWKNDKKQWYYILCKHPDGTEAVLVYKEGIRVGDYDRAAKTRAHWQRSIRAVIKQCLHEDKAQQRATRRSRRGGRRCAT